MAKLPDDWWPDFIPPLENATFLEGDHVMVAEIVEPTGPGTYRQAFTALAPKPVADEILSKTGSIGVEIDSSGPHPSIMEEAGPPGYEPRFWIFGGPAAPDGLEPLAVAWTSGNTTVFRLDQGFLMTYALVPRVIPCGERRFDEHWDDNETPKTDIVVSRPFSIYDRLHASPAWIRIRREYLEDYAFLRDRHLLHVVYGHADGVVPNAILDALRKTKGAELQCPSRKIHIHLRDDSGSVHVRYWIVRRLLEPRISPISAGRWNYGELRWPGIPEPLTHRTRMPLFDFVYINDSVLAEYEGRANEGFRIDPESGSVAFRGQWGVGYTHRIGRDLLQLEVRKLYEGCPPSVVRHWHAHAADPPSDMTGLHGHPNVATRSKRIVLGLLLLGESIGKFATVPLRRSISSVEVTALDRQSIENEPWWNAPHVEPITHHIPLEMKENRFLDRMTDLTKVVIEGFREKVLREIVLELGYDRETTKEWKSLRLLEQLVRHCEVANQAGLNPVRDAKAIADRLSESDTSKPVAALRALIALRTLDAHRVEKTARERMDEAISTLRIKSESTAAGWGRATDRVYDEIANAIEHLSETIVRAEILCDTA